MHSIRKSLSLRVRSKTHEKEGRQSILQRTRDRFSAKSKTPTCHAFSKLPPEIRHRIWDYAAINGLNGVCLFSDDVMKGTARSYIGSRIIFSESALALLLVNSESREFAQKAIGSRPFDPTNDILYIPKDSTQAFNYGWVGDPRGKKKIRVPPWAANIRHIGVTCDNTVNTAFGKSLPRLTTIFVVYSKSEEYFDDYNCWVIKFYRDSGDIIKLTESQLAFPRLRQLTKEEGQGSHWGIGAIVIIDLRAAPFCQSETTAFPWTSGFSGDPTFSDPTYRALAVCFVEDEAPSTIGETSNTSYIRGKG